MFSRNVFFISASSNSTEYNLGSPKGERGNKVAAGLMQQCNSLLSRPNTWPRHSPRQGSVKHRVELIQCTRTLRLRPTLCLSNFMGDICLEAAVLVTNVYKMVWPSLKLNSKRDGQQDPEITSLTESNIKHNEARYRSPVHPPRLRSGPRLERGGRRGCSPSC